MSTQVTDQLSISVTELKVNLIFSKNQPVWLLHGLFLLTVVPVLNDEESHVIVGSWCLSQKVTSQVLQCSKPFIPVTTKRNLKEAMLLKLFS